jgi:glycosyltransferase involved in cell wall biosynthesis
MTAGPTASRRVVLGMTLHNNARHLPDAAASILGQSYRDFSLLMLDDASSDDTPRIARAIVASDDRVTYVRHEQRAGMIPTWREVAEAAIREHPSAEYFAWVSDHDRWDPRWLGEMVHVLDANPAVVLAYPMTRRMEPDGTPVEKDRRVFQTAGLTGVADRWREFCLRGIGSGDMVYGLMRIPALHAAGIFREVMNPDRLLIAELTLQGQIHQVPEPLWIRRRSAVASIARQRTTLLAGRTPRWFSWPSTLQHAYIITREYLRSPQRPVTLPALQLVRMLAFYQVTSLTRTFRKTDTSKQIDRTAEQAAFAAKMTGRRARVLMADAANGVETAWVRFGRNRRKVVYETGFLLRKLASKGRRWRRRARFKLGTALRSIK